LKKQAFIAFVILSAVTLQGRGQDASYGIQFIQNKGQWDSAIVFKGELSTGAFFLNKKGVSVLLHNPADLLRMNETHHGQRPEADSALAHGAASPYQGKQGPERNILHSHLYSISFLQASDQVSLVADKPLQTYNNYFIGNDPSKWASFCNIYQAVTYRNIYPNIDIRYYTGNGQLKYDIIVHPGGDPNQIALKYDGVDKINITKRNLHIKTSVGEVQELAPYAYQLSDTNKTEVSCKYELSKDNTVRFKVNNFTPGQTLVIDPTLVFCSFSGSLVSNWGFTATPAPDGSFFSGGIVFGEGFQTNKPGAFQSDFAGGEIDVGIIKFSSNGSRKVYGTYLGGSANETPHSLICDPQGNLIVLGRTYSKDFPAMKRIGPGGNADIFLLKLNASGSALIGSLVIGGTGPDAVNIQDQFVCGSGCETATSLIRNYGDDSRSEVILDATGNIYVAASSQSPNDFPVTPGAFQTRFGGGLQDGVVFKTDPNCTNLIFSSFLGGSSDDAAFVIAQNPITTDIYVAGATASVDFPGNKAGVKQPAFSGGICDGFVTIISQDGSTQKATTYMGTPQNDAIYGIQCDKKGFPYIMGSTTGNWPVVNAAYSVAGTKQFVSKLLPDLSDFVYSTTFGSKGGSRTPNISPVAFLVDRCENVYVSGWGGYLFARTDPYNLSGTSGMAVTPNAIKPVTDNRDFYFIVIQKNASALLYGTFFGQVDGPLSISEHVDGGTSRYDQNGIIYEAICANCGGNSVGPFPTTPGVVFPRNGTIDAQGQATGCNMAAVKIAFNFAGVSAGIKSTINGIPDSSGCITLNVLLSDTVRNAKSYIWSFGDGTPPLATTSFQVPHSYPLVGNYLVMLVAIDSNSCNVTDTAYIHIRARSDRAALAMDISKIPPCESLSFTFSNLSTAPPAKPFTDSSFIWDFGDGSPQVRAGASPPSLSHSYTSSGTYIVRLMMVDTNYCNYPDELDDTLRVAPLVQALFQTPDSGCAPYSAFFNNTSLAGQQFFWNFGDGTTSTASSPTHVYPSVGTYRVSLVAIDSGTCNIIDSTFKLITVNPLPVAAFTYEPQPPQANVRTVFNNNSTGAKHYTWLFGDGDSAVRNNLDTVIHQYQKTGTFTACLIAYNQFECPDTACGPVETVVNPLLDIPNAFTPGRFGQNGIIKVQSFGIATMTFRIYNRWGQLVFETNDPNQGWDGTFRGKPEPMDVYAYTLEAQFFDGTKTTRKGDITLIR
jgi:gliding motility-associated-like protein